VTAGEATGWLGLDSEHMLAAVAGAGAQAAAAADAVGRITLPTAHDAGAVTSIVVVGVGTSALAGEVLQAFAAPRCGVPVLVVDPSAAPAFVGPRTLVFAVSFSGNGQATLTATAKALDAGARVVAVTVDGQLARLASAAGACVIGPVAVPGAAPVLPSRAALAATVVTLVLACEQLGLIADVALSVSATVTQLTRRGAELSAGGGIAAHVARSIGRTIPLIHGASGLPAAAARRWKTQVNENAKAPAFFGVQPDASLNEVCGFGQHGDVTRQVLTLVNLRTGLEDDGVASCVELFSELTSEALARVVDVEAEGDGDLARFFDLVLIGDFVSLHLAAREGIDPGPVPTAVELEQRLAHRR
jgi:glucose/mannose-6-phosphate isomerase